MLIASAVALATSLILSAETLQLARHPESALGCDLNSAVSCSAVAQSWQAEIVKFGGLSYPNAFFGIAAESVFVTIAVIGLARVKVPRWFATCTWLGGLAALAYSYWLSTQSLFVIHALCPWCLTLMFSTTIQFMALSHATVAVQGLPSRKAVAADDSDGEAEVAMVPADSISITASMSTSWSIYCGSWRSWYSSSSPKARPCSLPDSFTTNRYRRPAWLLRSALRRCR